MIVEEENANIRRKILAIASRVSLEYDLLINPIIISKRRFQQQQNFSFYRKVMEDGIRLSQVTGQLTGLDE